MLLLLAFIGKKFFIDPYANGHYSRTVDVLLKITIFQSQMNRFEDDLVEAYYPVNDNNNKNFLNQSCCDLILEKAI